ncbi:uncharacterized protein LACBIDRAFT_325414 [Laccaria bicolor S238N-H82]|uniref:Predicted protein n=1 Tax=Laccaria bicolor (strain S238N-H82 / ATCC MYA-4686) TaxID=486041 RepID=B0D4U5_LACBS|nr:uncharacterized protein LACBIDRAFT_325414 [Laccaria bicolor S238N-H82]EDR10404.1 predicted protein [Laccaria bicolor S238N-H82]|eukprot:XP_001878854.1 predicted protein [Laccaria bicolor S238N-H82]
MAPISIYQARLSHSNLSVGSVRVNSLLISNKAVSRTGGFMDNDTNHRRGIANLGRWRREWSLSYSHPIPRATTVAPRRHNVITSRSCYSRADPPADTRRVTGPPTVTRHNFIRSCCSRVDPPLVTRRVTGPPTDTRRAMGPPADTRRVTGPPTVILERGRSRVMSDDSLSPPAYTPVSTQRTIYAVPRQTINIVTGSTTGLVINPYVHAN